jgi:hypothetical protein
MFLTASLRVPRSRRFTASDSRPARVIQYPPEKKNAVNLNGGRKGAACLPRSRGKEEARRREMVVRTEVATSTGVSETGKGSPLANKAYTVHRVMQASHRVDLRCLGYEGFLLILFLDRRLDYFNYCLAYARALAA